MKEVIFKIEDRLIQQNPTPQIALDIFKGTWISKLPAGYEQYEAGSIPLFADTRVPDSIPFLGPITDKTVLDLGPLEGGQAYVLEKLGAKLVISVEANTILYLKCLIAKEILNMQKVHFLCGDVIEYLKNTTEQFDMCVASGILYHMADPIELLWQISQKINKLLIWTHYFDERNTARNILTSFKGALSHEFMDQTYLYHRQEYGEGFDTEVYCGGTAQFSNWLSEESILRALKEFGYTTINILQDGNSVNGPFILLTANK